MSAPLRDAIRALPARAWTPTLTASNDERGGADVAEVTGMLAPAHLAGWPDGLRLIVRRERPHPGAQLLAFEERDGYRYQVFATNTSVGQLAFLDARHRAHARVEDRIRTGKDTSFGRFQISSGDFWANAAWLTLAAMTINMGGAVATLAGHGWSAGRAAARRLAGAGRRAGSGFTTAGGCRSWGCRWSRWWRGRGGRRCGRRRVGRWCASHRSRWCSRVG